MPLRSDEGAEMIARRFTLICLVTAIAGTVLVSIVANTDRADRAWAVEHRFAN